MAGLFFVSGLWFLLLGPIVFIGFVLRNDTVLVTGLAPAALVGGGMLIGTSLQLPLALIAPADAIADTPRIEILAMHAAAMLAGAARVGLASRLASRDKTRA